MKTLADLFAGFGGATQGFTSAGYKPVFAIDNNQDTAEVYINNFGNHCLIKSVVDVDFRDVKAVHLHASTSCKSFSNSNHKGCETELDIWCANAVCRAIGQIKPDAFSLENVKQYAGSKSFALIKQWLREFGYACNVVIVNAKDFGVPQSRERLILRAWKKELRRPKPLWLWKIEDRISWYDAIADLIPTLKPQPLNSWQSCSLKEQGIDPTNLTALVSKDGSRKKKGFINTFALVISPEKPCPTLKALGGSQHCQQYSIVVNGDGYRISTEVIARLMSFPDSYKFSGINYKDCMGLGNAVPPLLAKAIAESFN
jgi:DNA (cytosine-5)-methyltransferase 1